MKKIFCIFVALLFCGVTFGKDNLNLQLAKVENVIDGDTVVLNTGYKQFSARLYGIDCMEISKSNRAYRQAYEKKEDIENIIKIGNYSKKILSEIVNKNSKKVYFSSVGIDVYSRALVVLYDENTENINDEMLNSGMCEVYKI